MFTKILIVHPGRQHSHQAAYALYRRGLLGAYWTGVPAGRVTRWFPGIVAQYGKVDIPAELIRWWPVTPSMRRIGGVFHQSAERLGEFLAHRLFDRRVSATLKKGRYAAIIGYETSIARSFSRAKRLGMMTILDAASLHYKTQLENQLTPNNLLNRLVIGQKEREIEQADVVIVPSIVARDTYIEGGVPHQKLRVVRLGADLDVFRPTEQHSSQTFTFVFAGNLTQAKGVDLLLKAFLDLGQSASGCELKLFGSGELHKKEVNPRIKWMGRVPQNVFAGEVRKTDCLVLPSRLVTDSYGLVVAEALASGVPVIVSEAVGAKELVQPGRNGWIVPTGDVQALANQMRWCSENRQLMSIWRAAARETAMNASWDKYHERFAATIESLFVERAPKAGALCSANLNS